MRYDRGNTPKYWNDYWSRSKSKTETYAKRNVLEYIERTKPKSVLDVGAGTGSMLAQIKHKCDRVGVDISETAMKYMKNRHGIEGYTLSAYDIDTLNRKFDLIVSNHTLEHLDDDEEFLNKCKSMVNENGSVFICVPNGVSTPEETDKHSHVYNKESLSGLMNKVFGNCETYHIGNHLFGISKT